MSAFLARRAIAAPQLARTFSSTSARPVAKITVIGTLGATPEIQATSTGREILKYSVASNTRSRGETKTSWWRVTCFNVEGNRRDFFQSLPKGCVSRPDPALSVASASFHRSRIFMANSGPLAQNHGLP